MDFRFLVKELITNIGISLDRFFVVMTTFVIFFGDFRFLQTILLCIVGELAGGGSVGMAVGVSDR